MTKMKKRFNKDMLRTEKRKNKRKTDLLQVVFYIQLFEGQFKISLPVDLFTCYFLL